MKIVENKKYFFIISALIILTGALFTLVQGVELGIDFTGGTEIEVDMEQYVETSNIRETVDYYDPAASINHIGGDRHNIVIRTSEDLSSEQRRDLFNELQEEYSLSTDQPLRVDQFGPTIGQEIQQRALLSILISALGMLIYITFRFELSYGIASLTALLHDILILLSVYAILNIPINNPFIAAVLTILGYSINDSIVVFDRVRENMPFLRKNNYTELGNTSISQTLKRSIITSITTLLTIIALYILGVEQIRTFALPLIAGILSGTYSSIFIATPVWVMIKEKQVAKKSYKGA
ncbi:protein translocase subunit SecF [Isachenkonia alkalipeptolytica]|uniref:protein translocase subunit SecF n=1 Tax=Isachenkonia alkalipeptolytica TaxID=2565777 RepID=UPI001F01E0CE|nr:protein translocase subunit SecF [Isachenkonia alkalipeptolytica]